MLTNVKRIPGKHGAFSAGPRIKLTIRLVPTLYNRAAGKAAEANEPINEWIAKAILAQLEKVP